MITNKKGQISVVRVGILVGVIGFVLIGAGVAAFLLDQQARRSPLDVPLYAGAQTFGFPNQIGPTDRVLYYKIPDSTPEQVAEFYQQRMNEHYGDATERCVRIPPTGELPMGERTESSVPLPYQYKCMFDNGGFNATQFTLVVIYPGYYHEDPNINTEGMTVVEYQQAWQP